MWAGKESICNAGDLGSIPELRRSPGEWKGYPLQYSGLKNSMDCIIRGVTKNQTWLSNFHFISCGLFWTREVCGWWQRSANLYHCPHSVEDGSYKTRKELSAWAFTFVTLNTQLCHFTYTDMHSHAIAQDQGHTVFFPWGFNIRVQRVFPFKPSKNKSSE